MGPLGSRSKPPASEGLGGITGMILAGGLGTRLRSVIGEKQKTVADVGGRPFLVYLLQQLDRAGIRKTIICAGYQGREVETLLGPAYKKMQLVYSHEPFFLGTAGALRFARERIDSRQALVLNGDSYCDIDLGAMHRWHTRMKARSTIVLIRVSNSGRYGRVAVHEDGTVAGFEEKGEDQGPGWVSAGIYLLARETIDHIPSGRSVSIEKEIFPNLIGCDFYGFKTSGQFIDIGTPESYAQAARLFSKG